MSWAKLLTGTLERGHAVKWLIPGGWSFPVPPELSAMTSPAIWCPANAPSIIILEKGTETPVAERTRPLFEDAEVISEFSNGSGKHLVIADSFGRHRLLIRACSVRTDARYVVKADTDLEMRLGAIAALHDRTSCKSGIMNNSGIKPSLYQTHRLVLLLKILDRLSETEAGRPTIRTIAADIVYPRSSFGRTIEWKSSSERRQTQRLVSEAVLLMKSGYRNLLKGRAARLKSRDGQASQLP